jgi:hypothetical protein
MADDNSEQAYSASSDDESYDAKEEVDRDEVKEVRKLSSKDTNRIRLWRFVVTAVVLLTAVAVTLTTYALLQQQEHENFLNAVRIVQCPNAIALHGQSIGNWLFVRISPSHFNEYCRHPSSLSNSPELLETMQLTSRKSFVKPILPSVTFSLNLPKVRMPLGPFTLYPTSNFMRAT